MFVSGNIAFWYVTSRHEKHKFVARKNNPHALPLITKKQIQNRTKLIFQKLQWVSHLNALLGINFCLALNNWRWNLMSTTCLILNLQKNENKIKLENMEVSIMILKKKLKKINLFWLF